MLNTIIHGDCRDVMKDMPDECIDLIFTSPPYAQRRASTYGGVDEDKYVGWFVKIAEQIRRILKPTGSFFLNIKPHTEVGERSLYVFDLVLALRREVGLLFVDEFCWVKNAYPGDLKGRFKNGFEPIYHFTIRSPEEIKFNPTACGTTIKESSIARSYRKQCGKPKSGSNMAGMNTTNIQYLEIARPSNVVEINNVSNQFSDKQLHPATFPEKLVEFFVKSFSDEGDVVLDPFIGSGTTALACMKTRRNYIGIEKEPKYVDIARAIISGGKYEESEENEPISYNLFVNLG